MRNSRGLAKPTDSSAALCSASILLYVLWLLLPAVQTTGRAATGAAAVALFGVGVLLDTAYLKEQWGWLAARAACAALMPALLWVFLRRGGGNFWGFYVQQGMFWFPLVYAGYARERGDRRLWRWLKWALLGATTLTTLTTIGWLIEGMLRGGRVYAYSRSLGFAGEGREAYLKELMLHNIGGYDFIYASVVALPFLCLGIQRRKGWRRGAFSALLAAQTAMIVLSQYTYAMIFAAVILVVEGVAALVRALSHGKVSVGASLMWGLVPIALLAALHRPLIALAAEVCGRLGLSNFAFSFEQLLQAIQGGATSEDSRMAYYLTALSGFKRSPLWGSLFTADKALSQHSDVLDLLSGTGVLGTAMAGGMIWLMGRGTLKGVRQSPARAQLAVAGAALLAVALLGTVCYSRDVMVVMALGALLTLEGEAA